MKLRRAAAAFVFALLAGPLFAADITIPSFEMITRGYMNSGTFQLATHGDIDLAIGGGYKFGGKLVLNFTGDNITDLSTLAATHLTFKEASVTINQLFGSPLNLTYFSGYDDIFANGDAFPTIFGTTPFASRYRGYLYFPTGPDYDGIYTVTGTGMKLSTGDIGNRFSSDLYLYQDANLGAGFYSADLRGLFNLKQFKIESFVGASFPVSTAGIYRAGLLVFYDTGAGGQFLTEIGIPRWDPVSSTFDMGLFYFLFEPRIDFGSFAIIPTLFWHPSYYNDQATNEVPTANMNVSFRFGNPTVSPATGGFETEVNYSTVTTSQISSYVSPYLRLVMSGVIWNFKINVKLYPFSLGDLVDGFLGVEAQF